MPTTFLFSDAAHDLPISANVDKVMSLVADGTKTNKVTNTAASPSWSEITNTTGGTLLWWFTRPLNPFNTGGSPTFSTTLYCWESAADANCGISLQMYRALRDGTEKDLLINWTITTEMQITADTSLGVSGGVGANVQFNPGDRLKFRLFASDGGAAMIAGRTWTFSYGMGSGAGNSFVSLPTLDISEQPGNVYIPKRMPQGV